MNFYICLFNDIVAWSPNEAVERKLLARMFHLFKFLDHVAFFLKFKNVYFYQSCKFEIKMEGYFNILVERQIVFQNLIDTVKVFH